ncbi:unnamed protein product [Clavelina lepadiformis]|uniref:Uncharacterized protein n=1 Tax=Clavelina lepadiformis TaxID=159417 RepID=A0ABP0F1Y4_CLALP
MWKHFARFCLLLAVSCIAKGELYEKTGVFGYFSSRDFPAPYPNNLNDNWVISVNPGYKVVLYFTSFDLEDSFVLVPCSQDFVEILDGPYGNNTMTRLCGNYDLYPDDAPKLYTQKFKSSTNLMTVRMVSDYSNDLPDTPSPVGFRAHYYAEDRNECVELREEAAASDEPESVGMCEHFCNNYPGGYYCSCRQGYVLHDDGYSCIGDCSNMILSSRTGVIESPGYPGKYSRKTDCNWKIQTEAGKNMELTFDPSFHVEEYQPGMCPYDYLQINDSSGSRGLFCGSTPPDDGAPIVSTTNWFKLHFHTDYLTELTGFRINYKINEIVCPLPDPPVHGRLAHVTEPSQTSPDFIPFGGIIRFECNSGFRLLGSPKVACLKDGSLSDHIPICEVF